jgi:hypothetical protein
MRTNPDAAPGRPSRRDCRPPWLVCCIDGSVDKAFAGRLQIIDPFATSNGPQLVARTCPVGVFVQPDEPYRGSAIDRGLPLFEVLVDLLSEPHGPQSIADGEPDEPLLWVVRKTRELEGAVLRD